MSGSGAEDHYSTLGVSRRAGVEELRKAYRRLAVQWHPDKNPENREQAEAKFKQLNNAYDILVDPAKRAAYDLFGGDGRVKQAFSRAKWSDGGLERQAEHLFCDVLRCSFGSQSSVNGDNGQAELDGVLGGLFGSGAFGRFAPSSKAGSSTCHGKRTRNRQLEFALPLTLEELYYGCVKHWKLTRTVTRNGKAPAQVQELLEIPVRQGWREGTRITFEGQGDELPDEPPSDIVFVVKEEMHPRFERHGQDLITRASISLATALTGGSISLETLDHRWISIPLTDIVHPEKIITVPGEGMPCGKGSNNKGDLHVSFDIGFPIALSAGQKRLLQVHLPAWC